MNEEEYLQLKEEGYKLITLSSQKHGEVAFTKNAVSAVFKAEASLSIFVYFVNGEVITLQFNDTEERDTAYALFLNQWNYE